MSRRARKKREKRPGLESWLKWQLNEFRIFPVSWDPWSKEDAKTFYNKNSEAIHRAAKECGREALLQEWIAEKDA